MRAGALRHRVTIQSKTAARNALGEEIITYVDEATVWARVETPGASEYADQQREGASATHQVTMRWREVAPTARLVWHDGTTDRYLEISGVRPDALRREIMIEASEVIG